MSDKSKANKSRKFIKASDTLFVLALLLLAAASYRIYQSKTVHEGLVADIYYQNSLIESIPLSEGQKARTFSYPENPHVVFVLEEDGSIAFKSSDCPDQICVRSGRLRAEHAFAACLPNDFLLVLRLSENAPSRPLEEEVDIVN